MNRPLVSVVMCVYNEEGYLKDTIDNILAQTLSDFEFIIVNDGSTDSTQDILESYAKIDGRIWLIVNNENWGVSRASNRGIGKARGKYIAIIDAGDIANNNRLEKQFDYLEAHQEIYVLGTQGRWIDEEKQPLGYLKMPLKVNSRELYGTGGAIHPSVMMRRELFDIIGLYDESLWTSQEFDLNMRALRAGLGMANLEDELVLVMERSRGMTLRNLKTVQKNQLKIKARYLPSFLSLWSVVYTARSLAGYLLPTFMLKKIIKLLRRK